MGFDCNCMYNCNQNADFFRHSLKVYTLHTSMFRSRFFPVHPLLFASVVASNRQQVFTMKITEPANQRKVYLLHGTIYFLTIVLFTLPSISQN